jgi:MFS family permease
MLAYVFVAPVATAAVARFPRRAVLVGADLMRAAAAMVLPFVTEVWQVYALVFLLQAASATFTPTFQSVIPDILPGEEEFTAALSLSRLAYDLESVLSPMLAAALLLLVPASALFFGTGAGFVASAALVAGTAIPWVGRAAGSPDRGRRPRLGGGIAGFVATPALRPVLAINAAVAAAGAFVVVQTVVIARTAFGAGDTAVALLLAANGAGSMLVALALPRLLRSVPERPVMLVGALTASAGVALAPLALRAADAAGLAAVGGLWLMVGMGWAAAATPVGRLIRRHVAPEDLAGAFAAQFSLSHACWLVTYPVAGWLGGLGVDAAAWVLAAVGAASTLVAARVWPRRASTVR